MSTNAKGSKRSLCKKCKGTGVVRPVCGPNTACPDCPQPHTKRTNADSAADPLRRKTITLRASEWKAVEQFASKAGLAQATVIRSALRALGIEGITVTDR